jgi:hypothetical protein
VTGRPRVAALSAAAALVIAAVVGCSSSSPKPTPSRSTPSSTSRSTPPPVTTTSAHHLDVHLLSLHLPEALSRSVVFDDGHSLLVCGGLTNGDHSVAQIWRVTPSTESVRAVGTLDVAVHDAAGALVSGRRVVIGGGGAHEVDVVQTCPTAGAGRAVGRLPTPSSDLVTAATSARTYVVGGYDGTRAQNAVLATDDGVHFRVLGHLRVGVRYAAAVVGPDALWVFGGDVNRRPTAMVQRVDLHTGAVTVATSMPGALSHASVVELDGVVYLAGGRTASGAATATIWRVDTRTGTVRRAGELPAAFSDAGAASAGATAYLIGGEGAQRWTTVVELRLT